MLCRLVGYRGRYRREVAIGFAAATLITALSLVPPYLAGYLIDSVVRPVQDRAMTVERGGLVAWIAVSAMALILAVRRQSNLLVYGRPAMATVIKVERKRTDKGAFWLVHYEWTTMSGATRTGKYKHGKKQVPAVGDLIPVVYDRDNTFRSSKYPMAFVAISEK